MANPWFRLYSEFSHDPKVQMMSEVMQRRLIMLFCERCQGETLHETERSFHWRISETELVETKALFMAKGFIDDGWNVTNWNSRQFLSDSSTDRVRKHRQGLKQDETLQKHPPPVAVTPPDTDTDSEQIHKQKHKKTSRAKRTSDERHSQFRDAIAIYWRHKNPSSGDLPWQGRDARALSDLLEASPDLTLGRFREFLQIRAKSAVAHGERTYLWIAKVHSFAQPLNQFNKPEGAQNGTERPSTTRLSRSQSAIDAAFARRYGADAAVDPPDDGCIPPPGDQPGHGGRVLDGLRGRHG